MKIDKKSSLGLAIAILLVISACSNSFTGSAVGNPETKNAETKKDEIPAIVTGIKKGNKAIDFSVTTIDGKTVSLKDYTDNKKPLLLYFWATWCPYCARDYVAVKNVYPQYKDYVAFLAVDLDLAESRERIEQYRTKKGLEYIDFALGNPKILIDYNIMTTTTKFAISREGVILWTGSGAVDENTWKIIFDGLKNS